MDVYDFREWVGPDTYLLNIRRVGIEMKYGELMLVLCPGHVKCAYSMQTFPDASWSCLLKDTRSLGHITFNQYMDKLGKSIRSRNLGAPDTVISDSDARMLGLSALPSDDRGWFKIIRHQ